MESTRQDCFLPPVSIPTTGTNHHASCGDRLVNRVGSFRTRENVEMEDFGDDYCQREMASAIRDLFQAQAALSRAEEATVINSAHTKAAWRMAVASARSSLALACSLGASDAEARQRCVDTGKTG